MARTHRSSSASDHLPKFFGKSGFPQNPNGVKRNGAGKYNWGNEMEDLEDIGGEFNMFHQHRRSNSSSQQPRPSGSVSASNFDDDVFSEEE